CAHLNRRRNPAQPEKGMSRHKPSRRDVLRKAAAAAAGAFAGGRVVRAEPAKLPGSSGAAEIDSVLRDAANAKQIPGVVAMAASAHEILYEGSFGTRRLGHGPAMTRDTVFRVASMIKTITSVAAMQLVEQGKLALNEPVPDVDPAVNTPQVL